jgi:hypothetical protein
VTINGKGDPPNLDTIIKILKMTTSDNDNIALMSVRKANAQLAAWGWEWEAIMRGKVKIMPDPFANIPMPTASQPYTRPAAAPPPPPKQFDNKDEIEKYFSKLELGPKLQDHVQQRLNAIERAWNNNGFLLWKDYDYLKTEANRRRRR